MRYLAALALFLIPGIAFGAGFAKQSLFLSQQSVTEGETVLIHAIVSNEATATFAGDVVFKDASTKVGSVPVTLDAGEAQAVSVSWKPGGGSHTITAELQTKDGTITEKQSAIFSIAKKPAPVPVPPLNTQPAAVESSAGVQEQIAKLSPGAAEASAPLFTLIDSGRRSAADVLDSQIAKTKDKLGTGTGSVLGVKEAKNAASNPMGTVWFILQTLYLYALTIVRFLVGSAGVFYPVLAAAFLYSLWRLFRRVRRPAY